MKITVYFVIESDPQHDEQIPNDPVRASKMNIARNDWNDIAWNGWNDIAWNGWNDIAWNDWDNIAWNDWNDIAWNDWIVRSRSVLNGKIFQSEAVTGSKNCMQMVFSFW